MSIKPAIITAPQVAEQTIKLLKSLKEMQVQVRLLERRLAATERSLAENESLRSLVKRIREESAGHFQSEWDRRKEMYPDIRLAVITKIVELLTPPKKDKGASSPGDSRPK
jgi:hypothetical protein